ncbi:MAG: hypothetical protein IIC59_14080 [Proteobacteria bacterium]|nr:hypothetical protein [Pseudomonadota bacterium]
MKITIKSIIAGLTVTLSIAACSPDSEPAVAASAAAEIDEVSGDYIEGVVQNETGNPEAGVWVIAETDELATPYRKIVVTDDEGRFVLPQLPEASFEVWVRGYGLSDSIKKSARPGERLELSVTNAASEIEAASIYPASYWLSLLEVPNQDPNWISNFKLSCQLCHQVGSLVTRIQDRDLFDIGMRKSTNMNAVANGFGREQLLDTLADWTARIRAGETPQMPPRPQAAERNVVITQWEWGDGYTYAHDEIATDKRNPSLFADGPIYGVDLGNDRLLSLNPKTHEASAFRVPTLNGFDTPWCDQVWRRNNDGVSEDVAIGFGSLGCPVETGITPYEGQYPNPANPHNPMFDADGKVWITTQVRREWDQDLPEFCQDQSGIAGNYHHRQLGWFDPDTEEFQLLDTCYGTHHLQFDKEGVLWTSGDSFGIGWFDPAKYDPDEPASLAAAQGYAQIIIDSDGDGSADQAIRGFNYGVIPNSVDGSVWTSQPGGGRGRLVRYDPTGGKFETYIPPNPGAGPRAVDIDTNGIVWVALGGSGHLGRFDRSRCEQTWGLGEQCSEGWTIYKSPGPRFDTGNNPDNERNADFHYYLFVDQFNTLGMGENTVILNGTASDSLLAFDQATEEFTVMRIPYPLNSYTRGLDGRIDDADAGWKGRALWYTNGLDPIMHSEIGRSYVGKVQMRPDPLAH